MIPAANDLVAYRDTWEYATILGFRPANGSYGTVNPPRFSWPYLKDVIANDPEQIPPNVFTLQLSRDASFDRIAHSVTDTPYNFFNACPPLAPGLWHWRVGYGPAPTQIWSSGRTFIIGDNTVVWDRTKLENAGARLNRLSRPRIGPPEGNWYALGKRWQRDPATRVAWGQLVGLADRTLKQPWWHNFPQTDRNAQPPATRAEQTAYIDMLKQLCVVAYVYRVTGDARYQGALANILTMAKWPIGGLLSPESAGAVMGGQTKMPSQAAELFATIYDMFHQDLSSNQRETLIHAVSWRLEAMFNHPAGIVWSQADRNLRHYGLAYAAGSHPYQNFTWAVPAVLLLAGDSEPADRWLPLVLNYLAGVTIPDGPDEGHNEGPGYGNEKAESMLRAMLLADRLLPELELGKNPVLSGLIDWYVCLYAGMDSLPWGDIWQRSTRGIGGSNLLRLAFLTGSPVAKYHWQERTGETVIDNPAGSYSRPWLEMDAWEHYGPKLAKIAAVPRQAKTLFLPEAGWAFVQSLPIASHDDYQRAVGMQFQMRPRGGYGHSYASDGSFLWHAYGETLNNGGGWQSWASLGFSRSPISHNTILINGRGHDLTNPYRPRRKPTARPLAYVETDDYIYWAADLTAGYRHLGGVDRIHRHVLFVDGRYFLIFDDLAVGPESDAVRFDWLFHVPQPVPLTLGSDPLGFDYIIGDVRARVVFVQPGAELTMENRRGREGYINPVTGEDHYPRDMARAASRNVFSGYLQRPPMEHNLWISNREPTREFQFLAALLAAGPGMPMPVIQGEKDGRITLTLHDGRPLSVSFNPALAADIVVDVQRVRAHARQTDPAP